MAEGFANHYGNDVLVAASAGLSPAAATPRETIEAMHELNVDISAHVPGPYNPLATDSYDLVVNMSGYKLPGPQPRRVLEWKVADPIGQSMEVYRRSRADIEHRVMRLILDVRRETARP